MCRYYFPFLFLFIFRLPRDVQTSGFLTHFDVSLYSEEVVGLLAAGSNIVVSTGIGSRFATSPIVPPIQDLSLPSGSKYFSCTSMIPLFGYISASQSGHPHLASMSPP